MRKLIVSLLNERQKVAVKQLLTACKYRIRLTFTANRWLATIYFAAFSRSFGREHHAVLQGQRAFEQQRARLAGTHALLRRNIHRLEKGLMMPNRKAIFAEDYINETVEIYLSARQSHDFDNAELRWASDVLTAYFAAVSDTTLILAARQKFVQVTPLADSGSVPFLQQDLPAADCSYQQLLSLCQRRHSVRWFLPMPVPRPVLVNAIRVASEAPSACNRQPFQFHLLHGQDAVAGARLAMGTTGFAENIPALIVVIGDLSCYQEHRDRHLIYIDSALASMQFMLAIEAQGFSSCPINWPDIEVRERQMQQFLKLKPYQRPVMLIAVGQADPQAKVAFSQKKNPELLIRE